MFNDADDDSPDRQIIRQAFKEPELFLLRLSHQHLIKLAEVLEQPAHATVIKGIARTIAGVISMLESRRQG